MRDIAAERRKSITGQQPRCARPYPLSHPGPGGAVLYGSEDRAAGLTVKNRTAGASTPGRRAVAQTRNRLFKYLGNSLKN
jgi:hypothetical protein